MVMVQMIRKQVYLEPKQDAIIKQRARIMGVTEAEVIRRAIDGQTGYLHFGIRDVGAWEREKIFIAKRMDAGPVSSQRKFSREEVYEERLSRYGR
jgi:hypothetical protein